MTKQVKQASPAEIKDKSDDSRLQIILAEYSYEQKRLETSLSVVNQTLIVTIAIYAFLASATVGVINFQTVGKRVTYSGLSIISLMATIATFFSFLRNYKARMEQTSAERALCRLRNYFVKYAPDIQIYLSGASSDAWPTPYTHRWSSASFWGWIALILFTGTMSCMTVVAFLFAAFPETVLIIKWLISVVVGMAVIALCYLWLDHCLKNRKRTEKPRFPNN